MFLYSHQLGRPLCCSSPGSNSTLVKNRVFLPVTKNLFKASAPGRGVMPGKLRTRALDVETQCSMTFHAISGLDVLDICLRGLDAFFCRGKLISLCAARFRTWPPSENVSLTDRFYQLKLSVTKVTACSASSAALRLSCARRP